MRYIPFLILFYIWVIVGRANPGGLLMSFPIIRWLTYIFIPLSLLIGFFYITIRGRYKKTVIDKPVLLLIFLMMLSTYLNASPWENLFYGIGVYLRYPLLFILFCNIPQSTSKGREFMLVFLAIVVLLTLEAVFNFLVFNKQIDTTFLTLGSTWGTTNAGIFFVTMISLLTAHALLKGVRYYHLLLLTLIIMAASIASIRTILLFSWAIIFVVFAIHKQWLATRGLAGVVIIITSTILLATLVNWHEVLSSSPLLLRFDPGYRLTYIHDVLMHILNLGDLLLGTGPRSMSPGAAGSAGVVYQYFFDNTKSVLNLGSNEYVKGLSELGIAGMLVYWFMLYRVLRVAWLSWVTIRRAYFSPTWLKVMNLGFFGIWIFYACFGLISNDLWRMDASSLIFWFFAAVIAVAYRNNRHIIGSSRRAAM